MNTRAPLEPRSHYLTCAGRQLHYLEWGDPQAPAVIAWHGLARNCRDFDELARHLAPRYRVICPDTLGRGLSQWSPDPGREYQLSFYAQLAAGLLDGLGLARVHWVGTSMGGAIGTVCAGSSETFWRGRLASLVLNDNAPQLVAPAVARIRDYAGSPPAFDTVTELEAFFRQVYQPFGWMGDAQWRRMTETSMRRLPDGRVTPHYDPALVRQFTDHPDDYLRWDDYDRITIPVLCLRGEVSDLVERETVHAMGQRGPGRAGLLQAVEVPGVGHAPALNVPEQMDLVAGFIDAAQARAG